MVDKDSQYAILKLCKPLWEAARETNMVVVGPMARYITAGCFENSDHAANRKNPDFESKIQEELSACGSNIKKYLFTTGMRHGRVMDPARNLRGLSAAEIWGSDPVHPREEIYDLMDDSVREVEKTCGSGQQKRKLPQGSSGGARFNSQGGQDWYSSSCRLINVGSQGGHGYGASTPSQHSRGGGQQTWRGRERGRRGGSRRLWGSRRRKTNNKTIPQRGVIKIPFFHVV